MRVKHERDGVPIFADPELESVIRHRGRYRGRDPERLNSQEEPATLELSRLPLACRDNLAADMSNSYTQADFDSARNSNAAFSARSTQSMGADS